MERTGLRYLQQAKGKEGWEKIQISEEPLGGTGIFNDRERGGTSKRIFMNRRRRQRVSGGWIGGGRWEYWC